VELYGALLRHIEDGLNDLQREGNPEVTPRPHCPDFFGCEFAGERTPIRGVTILAVEVAVVHVAIARKENCQGAGLSTTLGEGVSRLIASVRLIYIKPQHGS